ncbi:MAG TPA: DUF4270 family protein, partial [Flavobacteriales bacterium]|nr:DUF4270 family protein [Flavobacteriales bacterium]
VGEDTLVPQLRIPLSLALGQELLSHWGGPELADNASFVNYFKGLFVSPYNPAQAPQQGGIWYFNLRDGNSKLTLYFHDTSDGVAQHFDFLHGTSSVRYTYSEFDRSQATDPRLNNTLADTALGQTEVYVQTLGGIRSELRFPYLDKYAGTELMAIAKAELVMPISEPYFNLYEPPQQLFVFRKGDDGTELGLPDQITGQGFIGGIFDGEAQSYTFNITRWVQGVINGTYPNTGLGLVAGANGVSANRATLSGPEEASKPMKLRLTFTTY